jgi:IS5 family transposase
LQQWFNLSDPAVEESLYDSLMRKFVGIDLGREPTPVETTVYKLRHLLEEHEIGLRCWNKSISACTTRAGKLSGAGNRAELTAEEPEMKYAFINCRSV